MAKHPVFLECKAPGHELSVKGNNYTVGADLHDGKPFAEALRYRAAFVPFNSITDYKHDDLGLTINLDALTVVMTDANGKTIAYACSIGEKK